MRARPANVGTKRRAALFRSCRYAVLRVGRSDTGESASRAWPVSADLHLREGLRESSLESNHAKFGMRSPAFQYALLFFVEPSHGGIPGFWYMSSSKSNDIP